MNKEHSYAYEAGYRDGAINYELDHCPACKNVADLQEALEENAKLREELEHFEVVMQEDIDGKLDCLTPIYLTPAQAIEATLGRGELERENAELLELVRDLYGLAWPECPGAAEAYLPRIQSLGVEVDG